LNKSSETETETHNCTQENNLFIYLNIKETVNDGTEKYRRKSEVLSIQRVQEHRRKWI